jgi:hypothetical protein
MDVRNCVMTDFMFGPSNRYYLDGEIQNSMIIGLCSTCG